MIVYFCDKLIPHAVTKTAKVSKRLSPCMIVRIGAL